MQFVMRLAREFRRADWRRMLSEMSATELGEWGDYFRMQSFSDVWMDAQFASLKALIVRMVSGSSDAAVADFSLLPEENGIPERTDEELMQVIVSALEKRLPYYTKAKWRFNAEELESYAQIDRAVNRLKNLIN